MRLGLIVSALILALNFVAFGQSKPRTLHGWSVESTELPQFWDKGQEPVSVYSPDRNFVLRVVGKSTGESYPSPEYVPDYFIERGGKRISELSPNSSPEAMWSPDSRAIAITSTDGGAVGGWGVQVYVIKGDNLKSVDVTENVRRDVALRFPTCQGKYVHCSQAEARNLREDVSWVNVAAIKWIRGTRELVVMGGVPCSSSMGSNMCKLMGYIVEVPTGRIVKSYTRKQFMSAWGRYFGDWEP